MPASLLPGSVRRLIRQFWRLDRINERRKLAEIAIDRLTDEREIKILSMRHGLLDGNDRTLEEIGHALKLTRERARQIEASILIRLEGGGLDVASLRQIADFQRAHPSKRRHLTTDIQRKKADCRRQVRDALADGRIIRQGCSKCGNLDAVAHHHGYDKPLDVEWLCRHHHMVAHRGLWIDKLSTASEPAIVKNVLTRLKEAQLSLKMLSEGCGLSIQVLRNFFAGQSVRDETLLQLLRYVDSL